MSHNASAPVQASRSLNPSPVFFLHRFWLIYPYKLLVCSIASEPIVITTDILYVSRKVIQICTDNGWDYIIRYKEESVPSIAREYQALPEKEKVGSEIEYHNHHPFRKARNE